MIFVIFCNNLTIWNKKFLAKNLWLCPIVKGVTWLKLFFVLFSSTLSQKFVKFEQKLHQKPEIFNLKPSKNTLWAKNPNFYIRIFFKYMFLEPSRGPLQIATMISEACFQKFFDRKTEPCVFY